MNDLKYALRQVLRGRNNNLTKIISLVFGLTISLVIFITIAFQMSYDKFHPDVDNLYVVNCQFNAGEDKRIETTQISGPIPYAMMESLDEVVSATTVRQFGYPNFKSGDQQFSLKAIFVDSLFFKTLGFEISKGKEELLAIQSNVFISESAAERYFGEKDPVGEVLRMENETSFTIVGIFKDFPPNSQFSGDIIMPIRNLLEIWGFYYGFEGGDSFFGYVKLAPGTDPEIVNEKLPGIWHKYWDVEKYEEVGYLQRYYLTPLKTSHTGSKEIRLLITILAILGVTMLLITTFNYVLLSVSAINRRARTVGVHKFCGSSSAHIFKLFAWETLILIGFSFTIIVLIIIAFRSSIPLFDYFLNLKNISIVLLIILVISAITITIPGLMLASVPAKQIYQKVISSKRGWKQVLLLVQFSGIAFIINIIIITFAQYHFAMNLDVGYNMDNVAQIELRSLMVREEEEQILLIQTLQQELSRLPFVEHTATAEMSPLDGYGGAGITDSNHNTLFTARGVHADPNYLQTLGYELLAGRSFNKKREVVVNELFVEKMGWTDNPIGKEVPRYGTVVGVVKNPIGSVFRGILPTIFSMPIVNPLTLFVSMSEVTTESLTQLNQVVQEVIPNGAERFICIRTAYNSGNQFIAVIGYMIMAAVTLLILITLMGLLGFVADEIRRRSKEIAIRKVFGAESSDVIRMTLNSLLVTTLIALIIGSVAAFFTGRLLLQFFLLKITLSPLIFVAGSVIVCVIIFIATWLKTRLMLRNNPLENLQKE